MWGNGEMPWIDRAENVRRRRSEREKKRPPTAKAALGYNAVESAGLDALAGRDRLVVKFRPADGPGKVSPRCHRAMSPLRLLAGPIEEKRGKTAVTATRIDGPSIVPERHPVGFRRPDWPFGAKRSRVWKIGPPSVMWINAIRRCLAYSSAPLWNGAVENSMAFWA